MFKYEVGDRVVINDTYDWEPLIGLHGLVTVVDDPDRGSEPGRPYCVWVDGRNGGSPNFAESELDPE
jgi:hypothetical protein